MISRWRAIGFLLAALGLVLALLLPLSSEATPALTARGALLAAIIAEVVLFALAAPFPRLETVAGLIAAVLGCAATLILLKDLPSPAPPPGATGFSCSRPGSARP